MARRIGFSSRYRAASEVAALEIAGPCLALALCTGALGGCYSGLPGADDTEESSSEGSSDSDSDAASSGAQTDGGGGDGGDGGGGSVNGDGGDPDDDGGGDGDGPVFDVGHEAGDGCGGQWGDAEYEFSVIWIANSPEGTVSKIDTQSRAELARYATGPGNADPSRTTVNLQGDVAIANRAGSLTKIATRLEDCIDSNNDNVITTSEGRDDVLEWGEDECVLWHHDVPFAEDNHQGGPRAAAWDAFKESDDECAPASPRVWVGWRAMPSDDVILRRIEGATGELEAEVLVPDWDGNWGHGSYGGAVDAEHNFWAIGTRGTLIRVDGESLNVSRFENPGHISYGIALDPEGNPWLAGWDGELHRFDVDTETFESHGDMGARLRGLAIDANGHAWIATNSQCGLVRYDTETAMVLEAGLALPNCQTPVGVSLDVAGFVWVVDKDASLAYRVDSEDYSVEVVDGLNHPYTYSDMTGAGLDLVINPPG